eukprot:NODE_688_length_5165_cov_0.086656.p2 type:complete len:609 gc:universal NODE_688_length_5165_cov_0.086656:2667-4493(+)
MKDFPSVITAVHDYKGKDKNELSFKKNDLIIVIETDYNYENDGWWKGKCKSGKVGLFPVNHTDGIRRQKQLVRDSALSDSPATTPVETAVSSTTVSIELGQSMNQKTSGLQIAESSKKLGKDENLQSDSQTRSKNFKKKKKKILSPGNPNTWSVDDVVLWLESNNFSFKDHFIENEISGDVLLQLNLANLKEIGVAALGQRLKLFNKITQLNNDFKNIKFEEINPKVEPDSYIETATYVERSSLESEEKVSIDDDEEESEFGAVNESGQVHLPASLQIAHNSDKTVKDTDDDIYSSSFSPTQSIESVKSGLSLKSVESLHDTVSIPHINYYPDVTRIDKLKNVEISDHIKVMEYVFGVKTYKKRFCALEKGHFYVFHNEISKHHIKLLITTKVEDIPSKSSNYYLKIDAVTLMFENFSIYSSWKAALLKYTIFHSDHFKSKQIEIVPTIDDALKGTSIKQPNMDIKGPDQAHDDLSDIINSYSIESDRKYDFHELKVTNKKQRPYISYINKYLSRQGVIIKDLKELVKGDNLLLLLKELSDDDLPDHFLSKFNKDAKYKLQIKQNLQILKSYMEYLGINVADLKLNDILTGEEDELFYMMDNIYDVFE